MPCVFNHAAYLDDVSMYNNALEMRQNDLCAGLEANFDVATGQGSESGRDQGVSALFFLLQAADNSRGAFTKLGA